MTQIGFVGLGKMGGNMVHRIRRDSEHEVVAFDFDEKAVKQAVKNGAAGAELAEGPRQTVERAADRVDHGARGRADATDGRQARQAAGRRRHDRRRRQFEVDRRQAPGTSAEGQGHRLRRRGHLRRRVGPGGRLLHDGRRPSEGGRAAGADPGRAGAGDQRAEPRRDRTSRLAALRPIRRGALREDGPQRRGVRPDAGLRGGLRPVRQVRVRARQRQDRAPVGTGFGRALVAVRTGRAGVRGRRQRPADDRGLHRGLRRGPLDDRGRDRPRRAHAGHHRLAVRAAALARQRRLRRPRAGGAAQPVRRATRSRARPGRPPRPRARPARPRAPPARPVLDVEAADRGGRRRSPNRSERAREPTHRRPGAPAGRADDARHLRRHRRPRQAQTAAGAVQPRPRGGAARALPPGGRLAQRESARGLPRRVRRGDPPLLPAHARRRCAQEPAREHQVRPGHVRRGLRVLQAGKGARRL